jgi:phosphoribosylglycinamide formyltransferase-1
VEVPGARSREEVMARLQPIEHELLPDAVRLIAAGRVRLSPDDARRVIVDPVG